jgi:tRNA A-37 threonylcarbamoyl transferase component Bud32
MEFVESSLPIAHPDLPLDHRDRWTKELQNLVSSFHARGLVHGDLRDANIICKGDSVMLIDFDWGGKDGQVFYRTANLNQELRDGRASNDLRIIQEDDRRVLGKTLAKLATDIHIQK